MTIGATYAWVLAGCLAVWYGFAEAVQTAVEHLP